MQHKTAALEDGQRERMPFWLRGLSSWPSWLRLRGLTFSFPAGGKPCVLRRKGTVTCSGVPGLSPLLADLLTGMSWRKCEWVGLGQLLGKELAVGR